jgi:hypothetical protein
MTELPAIGMAGSVAGNDRGADKAISWHETVISF